MSSSANVSAKSVFPVSRILPAALLFCVLCSCAKKEPPPPPENPAQAAEGSTAVRAKPEPTVPMKPAPPPRGAPAKEAQPPPKPQAAIAKEDPLFGPPGALISASDFTLGSLQTPYRGGAKEKEAYRLFSGFLEALRAGEDVSKYLHPKYRDFLRIGLDAAGKEGRSFETFRIGTILSGKGDVFEADIILLGKEGRTSGKVLAETSDSALLVSGFLADLSRLKIPYRREDAEPYLPVSKDSPFR